MDALKIARAQLALFATAALLGVAGPAAAQAPQTRPIDVPAGRLSDRVPQLARQAGISISVTSDALWRTKVKPVRGTMTPAEAIARMLAGTRSRAVQLSATSWRIDAVSAPAAVAQAQRPRRPVAPPPPPAPPAEVESFVVTASKLDQRYEDYPGAVHLLDGSDLRFGGERGTDSIASRLASVASTHLGSGRNKLFIRGIADSSFTGPTQATVGQYLGDLRLTYNAPDPDLRLQDIKQVEVLEGSQGTLYGAGSLGGIIRLVPNDPDPRGFTVETSAGLSFTQHGEPGADVAATVNMPIGTRGHALRLTGYGITDGGYIDNPVRGVNDVNRTRIAGGRAVLRLDLGDAWTVDVGGIYQSTLIDDSQYADRDAPPLTRNSFVVEDANADYGMATLVVRKDFGALRFQSSNAYVSHGLDERFDATRADTLPRVFEQRNRTRMLTSETRLWRPVENGFGWVLGVSAIDNEAEQRRAFGLTTLRAATTGVRNRVTELTGYGKLSVEVSRGILLSGGGRITHSRLSGSAEDVQPLFALQGGDIVASRTETKLLPSGEVLAHLVPGLTVYARYEEGFRPGGLAIESQFVRQFRNDHIQSLEGGVRMGSAYYGFAASLSAAYAYWRDIQADFIDGTGLPTTANIGNGRITSIAGSLSLFPIEGLQIDLNAVYNHSRVIALTPEAFRLAALRATDLPVTNALAQLPALGSLGQLSADASPGSIPNVAEYAAQARIDYRVPLGAADLRLAGWLKYIGPSRLGIGPVLGDEQGDYVDTGVTARYGDTRRGVTLSLTNLLDTTGNRFALGTPFGTGTGGYTTPQRPRTVRIAVDYRY
ncbi:outer membrane receptor protein involved in Fe transport [Sphingobium sp. B1D7B]|uniref:TonB-dependent receptor n=1 Tax=unclassified Sphingobium TaxID=2611147 RepID=UPI0022245A7C|nr:MULTISPECIES: TonB-dependent receptor plug domain-containing protein [unclassified Sphingobium]MCW2391762.1 outer membrane receptor protein involved in Fe transport [Sphingobium sp. B11D3A]MCW2403517.1 outer membrane receptor protein involved in Fe transport [Sphingobium sp. B1D7B]